MKIKAIVILPLDKDGNPISSESPENCEGRYKNCSVQFEVGSLDELITHNYFHVRYPIKGILREIKVKKTALFDLKIVK